MTNEDLLTMALTDENKKMFHGYQMEWVAQMNNIRSRAAEIVNANLIFA